MKGSRIYKRTSVKQVELSSLVKGIGEVGSQQVTVGLDVGKYEIVACLRWNAERVERPWSVKNPYEIDELVELLQGLKKEVGSLRVGLESTGTYGESVRRNLTLGGIEVHRVGGKAVSDYKEVYDGVPSQHDGKDAAVIAELTAFGKGVAWPFVEATAVEQEMEWQVDQLDAYRVQQVQWLGRLEGLLAEHWPELGSLLELGSVTTLSMLAHYHSPASVAGATDAGRQLRRWGGSKLTSEKIRQVLESAQATRGVPVREAKGKWISKVAGEALSALREIQACERELSRLVKSDKSLCRYVSAVGASTLAVIIVSVGHPRNYGSSGAFLKVLGLNLKELSSGRRKGELSISKRGPSRARKWIFMWALRGVQQPDLESWYTGFTRVGSSERRHGPGEHRKMKGIVALMRKLCRGLWHAMKHEEDFDYGKLFSKPGETSPSRRRRLRRRRAAKQAQQRIAVVG